MIYYQDETNTLSAGQLGGFFVGWKKPPTTEQHLKLLYGSTCFIAAIDGETGKVVGFVTALSDGVISAFIPLIEVLPDYRGKGIGTELMERILSKLSRITNIDLTCDEDVQPFYERFNMLKSTGMIMRKFL